VAVSGEHAAEIMSPAAGLHPDDARRKLLRQSNQARSLQYVVTSEDGATGLDRLRAGRSARISILSFTVREPSGGDRLEGGCANGSHNARPGDIVAHSR